MAADGRLQPQDMVWQPRATKWCPAASVEPALDFSAPPPQAESPATPGAPPAVSGLVAKWSALDERLHRSLGGFRWPLYGLALVLAGFVLVTVASAWSSALHLRFVPSLLLAVLTCAAIGFLANFGRSRGWFQATIATSGEANERDPGDLELAEIAEARRLLHEGKTEEAADRAREGLARAEALPHAGLVSDACQIVGLCHQVAGRFAEAAPWLERGLQSVAKEMQEIGTGLGPQERASLEQLAQQQGQFWVFGDYRRKLARLRDLAALFTDGGDTQAAERCRAEAVGLRALLQKGRFCHLEDRTRTRMSFGNVFTDDYYPDAVVCLTQRAREQAEARQLAEAHALFSRALRIRDRLFGSDPVGLEHIAPGFAQVLLAAGRASDAQALLGRVHARSPVPPGGSDAPAR
jgi:tetratricopeptide (TPR) repeat protein